MAIWSPNSEKTKFLNNWSMLTGNSQAKRTTIEEIVWNRGPNKQVQKTKFRIWIWDNEVERREGKAKNLVSVFGHQPSKRVRNF